MGGCVPGTNSNEVPTLYNKGFINKDSKNKTGKARDVPYDVSPKSYKIPNFVRNNDKLYLKIVSWNINMDAISAYASDDWSQNNDKYELIYQQTNEQNPDIITFQELSKSLYYQNLDKIDKLIAENKVHPLVVRYIKSNEWIFTHEKASHCGYVIVLVNKRLHDQGITVEFDDKNPDDKWPGIILYKNTKMDNNDIKTDDNNESKNDISNNESTSKECVLVLFGVHMAPFGGEINAHKRRRDFDRMYKSCVNKGWQNNFVLIGDTNMRYNEEQKICQDYKNEIECNWNIIPSNQLKNGFYSFYRNFFEVGSQGISRYDKIFYGNNIKCIQFSVFDKSVSHDKYHFLSDHRAISGLMEISV